LNTGEKSSGFVEPEPSDIAAFNRLSAGLYRAAHPEASAENLHLKPFLLFCE